MMTTSTSSTRNAWMCCLLLASVSVAHGQGSWVLVNPMPVARFGAAAATGPDGRIYTIGGRTFGDGSYPHNEVLANDTAADSWTFVSPLIVTRSYAGVITGYDGRIYVFGGAELNDYLQECEVYDVEADAWSQFASMPTFRMGMGVAADCNGRIYTIGGWNGSILNVNEAYDPSTDTWTVMAPMPTPRYHLKAVTGSDGRIYAIGGDIGPGGGGSVIVEAYDPTTDTWKSVAPLSVARGAFGASIGIDGLIYVFGGFTDVSPYNLDSVEAYDVGANVWIPVASLLIGRGGSPGSALGPDGRIYAIGCISCNWINGLCYTVPESSVEAFSLSQSGMNHPPAANAGSNRDVIATHSGNPARDAASLTLDGTGSSDPDGDSLTYVWIVNGAPAGTGSTVLLKLPPGSYSIDLIVTDTHGASDTDTITVTVEPSPNGCPLTNAGSDQTVTVPHNGSPDVGTATFTLDGTASIDPDSDFLSYSWQDADSGYIEIGTTPQVALSRPSGTYHFLLECTDPYGCQIGSMVTVTVNPEPNGTPVLAAPTTVQADVGCPLTFSTSATDPDGDTVTYDLLGAANGATINSSTGLVSWTPSAGGAYLITIRATDPYSASDAKIVSISVCPIILEAVSAS